MESVTQILAEGMANAGHQVQVLCFTKGQPSQERLRAVLVTRMPVNLERASQPLGLRYFFGGLRAARRAQVIHLHAPNLLASLMCLWMPRRAKLLVHWHSDVVGKGRLGSLVRPLERRMLNRADLIVATSQAYAEASPLLNEVAHKVQVIPIGLPSPQPVPGMHAERDFNSFLRSRRFVLAVGRLVPYKGFAVLVAAARYLPDGCAVVIGGSGPLADELAGQVHDLGLADRVLLTGRLSEAELEQLLSRAMTFCLPSVERSEAFGVVLLEAMARGVPCVSTTIAGSGTSWVNMSSVSGLNVAPGDPRALAAAIQTLFDDTALHRRLATGAVERYRSLFTARQSIDAFATVYERLTREGG